MCYMYNPNPLFIRDKLGIVDSFLIISNHAQSGVDAKYDSIFLIISKWNFPVGESVNFSGFLLEGIDSHVDVHLMQLLFDSHLLLEEGNSEASYSTTLMISYESSILIISSGVPSGFI